MQPCPSNSAHYLGTNPKKENTTRAYHSPWVSPVAPSSSCPETKRYVSTDLEVTEPTETAQSPWLTGWDPEGSRQGRDPPYEPDRRRRRPLLKFLI